ncbi:MAG: hypothetical protein WHV67_10085, partial [Thermoanaerobaculia bacterium]
SLFLKKILSYLNIKEDILSSLIFLFPVPLYFSAEARAYSLILFLSSIFFYEILTKKRPFLLAVIFILLAYTHYISLFYFSFLIFLLFLKREKKYLLSIILSFAAVIPLIFLFRVQPKESLFWASNLLNIKSPFLFFSNLGPNLFENFVYNFFPLIPPLIFFFPNFFISLYQIQNRNLSFITIPFILNISIIFLISFSYKNLYVPSRTESFFFIPFAIFLLDFLSKNFKLIKVLKYLYFIIAIISLILIFWSFSKGLSINREMEQISSLVEQDTKICVFGYWKLSLIYQIEKAGKKNEVFTFPPSQNEHQGWYFVSKIEEEDKNWFEKNITHSKERWLILWDKSNPYAKTFLSPLQDKLKLYETENFYFAIKN